MGMAAAIPAAVTVAGSIMGNKAAKDAANAQVKAANSAADLQAQMFNKQIELQAPFREAGLLGQNRLLDLLGLSKNTGAEGFGRYARDFSMADYQADPGYQFRLGEGLKALDAQAAARGGLISGNALKAAQNYGQQAASQEYQNAFNRYQMNRANQLQPLQSLAGLAQSSANTLGGAAQNYAGNAGEAYMGAGNARASGYIGSTNALNQGIGNAFNMYNQNQMLGRMGGGFGTGPVQSSGPFGDLGTSLFGGGAGSMGGLLGGSGSVQGNSNYLYDL